MNVKTGEHHSVSPFSFDSIHNCLMWRLHPANFYLFLFCLCLEVITVDDLSDVEIFNSDVAEQVRHSSCTLAYNLYLIYSASMAAPINISITTAGVFTAV